MQFLETRKSLTHKGVMAMLEAAIAEADSQGQPQCIVIVDSVGQTLGEIRMTGSKFLSTKSARSKALTAASIRVPSTELPEPVRPFIAAATGGDLAGLPGGLPISFDGEVVGGIGIGSGAGEQDIAVARAALAAIGADEI
ncbi:MAG: GlcG/HbpS family heme-binding protein [Rhizobiaceae bacterium]